MVVLFYIFIEVRFIGHKMVYSLIIEMKHSTETEENMRSYRVAFGRNKVMAAGLFILAIVVLWSICGIKASAAEGADNDRETYQIEEQLFVKEVRNSLEAQGYYNSGITVTKVMDTDGSREYKVLVHHRDMDLQDEDVVDSIYYSLNQITMDGENVSINYQLF